MEDQFARLLHALLSEHIASALKKATVTQKHKHPKQLHPSSDAK